MGIDIFNELGKLVANPKLNFFPAPLTLPSVGADSDGLLLLRLVNDNSSPTPQLPLTISAIQNLVESVGRDDLQNLGGKLLDAIKSGNPINAVKAIVEIPQELEPLARQGGALLSHQLIIGASLVSIFKAVDPRNEHNVIESVYSAHSQYFFADGGYTTVADQKIAPPDLPSADGLKAFFAEKTGERYVRDLTRVGFEAVANDTWGLIQRYGRIDTTAAITNKAKAKAWFKGYSDYAEAGVTSAVEQALSQGGGPVQANPLLAASIATAAGTAARKATQHVFLQEIGI
jgi:hypothetical protein